MAVGKGTQFGPYEILSLLGSGGMGEVWRAHDHRLRRDVAVKVLSQDFATDQDLLQRFEQEAKAAGSLNHPGLVTIYDVGLTDGTPYIVMELLEGQTLRDIIGDAVPTRLPARKAIEYGIQIASALSVAHAHGIVHRDLKPENLFVTADRRVKIFDFGLAKLARDRVDANGRHRTAKHLTSAGMVVGTPSYMSPEQVRAEAVDHRTDIFSLGSVLYEMITGNPAFERSSVIETMHAVITDDPPPIAADVSPALDEAIRHCLEKDPRERFQSARDLAFYLRTLPELQRGMTREVQPLRRRRVAYRAGMIALPLLLAAAAGGFVLRGFRSDGTPAIPHRYRQLTSTDGMETLPTLAPDGKSFAFVSSQSGNRDIYVQRVDGRAAINITADSPDDDSEPAFSPDGAQIAFRSEREGGGIFVMSAIGESPRRVTEFGFSPAWSPDGTKLVFATQEVELLPSNRGPSSALWIVDVRSGARRPLVQGGRGGADYGRDSDSVQPSWSPHGKRIAVWGHSSTSGKFDIWTIDPNAREPKKTVVRVTPQSGLHWNPTWSPDGKYLYYGTDADGTLNLWRVPMDEDSGAPVGPAEPVALPAAVAGNFAFAKSGEMAYVSVTSAYRVLAMPFDVSTGKMGVPRQLFGGSQAILSYQPSPDGKMIAYQADTGNQEDIFVADADGTHIRQLTNDAAQDRSVHWLPDGKTLYFYSNRGGNMFHIWSIRADGSGLTRVTDDADTKRLGVRQLYQPVASPDGRTVIVQTDRETSALVHLDRPRGQRIEPVPAFLPTPKWSPDGQFIVARSKRVQSAQRVRKKDFPGAILLYSLRTRQTEKLSDSGVAPHWTPDGKKIVYFEREEICVLDLASRALTRLPFTPHTGARIDLRDGSRLSRDASTLYVLQTTQQGDIWMRK